MFMSVVAYAGHNLVLLHTNDTHSNIQSDASGHTGVLPRKAIIDSVRNAEKNVILIDAGDVVQGTLYFKFFRGDVEFPLMDLMGYDYMILGNHEFDNGLDELAAQYKKIKTRKLNSNYDFSNTPLKGMFSDYDIRKIDGKKIGFFGINVNPVGLITQNNYEGLIFREIIPEANRVADFLKNVKKCDLVVCVSHIGYSDMPGTSDVDLAKASENIDIIIGGHSHTYVNPADPAQYLVANRLGRNVLVAQTGKYGNNVGYIKIDLDRLGSYKAFDYEWIPVTDRFPADRYDKRIMKHLAPYTAIVDSINRVPVGFSLVDMPNGEPNGFANWTADFARNYGRHKADSLLRTGNFNVPGRVDLGIMNIGGIRQPMHRGVITKGQILSTFPFSNRMVLLKIKGSDLAEALNACAAKGGEAVSDEVRVITDGRGNAIEILIDGYPIDADKEYLLCTIDYLAWGNDYLSALKKGEIIWTDEHEMSAPVLDYIQSQWTYGLPFNPDPNPRFVVKPVAH